MQEQFASKKCLNTTRVNPSGLAKTSVRVGNGILPIHPSLPEYQITYHPLQSSPSFNQYTVTTARKPGMGGSSFSIRCTSIWYNCAENGQYPEPNFVRILEHPCLVSSTVPSSQMKNDFVLHCTRSHVYSSGAVSDDHILITPNLPFASITSGNTKLVFPAGVERTPQ